jgi:protoporphyrinogen oxidase
MKRYAIPIVIVLAVLALVMVSFGQAQDREAMRERFRNMSEEERAAFMQRMRERGFGARMSREDQEKAVKAIEEQVAKLKAAIQVERPEGGFQDLPEEQRNKLRQSFRDRRTALQTIVTQIAALQGRTQPEAEDARFIIINTADLKPIQEMAEKEKAKETAQLLARMASRGSVRGFGGRRPGGQRGGQQ